MTIKKTITYNIFLMNPSINLLHLKFFCDAVAYESISEAAKMNFVSPSAASQAIAKLEAIFGVQLFFHNRQKLQVTEQGMVVYEQARLIFKTVQNTFEKVNQTKETFSGTLRFVTTKSLGMSFIAPIYKKIRKNVPLLDFKFRMGGLNLIRNALRRDEAEFAIVVFDNTFEEFAKHPLKKGKLHLYQAQGSASDLIDQGVFIDEYKGMYIKELEDYLGSRGHKNPIQDAIAGWELVARFTELNVGVGFFPDYLISNNRFPNIERHPLALPDFSYEICAIYNKGVKLTRSAQIFLEEFTLE